MGFDTLVAVTMAMAPTCDQTALGVPVLTPSGSWLN